MLYVMTINKHNLREAFVVLDGQEQASVEPCDPGLYARLDANYDNFKGCHLVACHAFSSDWPAWEIHPAGDEIVVLMSGSITFVLRMEDGEQTVTLSAPGDYAVVPKNVWHTARTDEPCQVLFITPGEGTGHAAEPEAG